MLRRGKKAAADEEATDAGVPGSLSELVDLDATGDEVSADEVAGVLESLGLGKDGSGGPKKRAKDMDVGAIVNEAQPKAAPAPPPKPTSSAAASSSTPTPSARPPASDLGEMVGNRVREYQRAAVAARQRGEMEAALHWLRKSKAFVQGIEAVMSRFASPEDEPWPAPDEATAERGDSAIADVSDAALANGPGEADGEEQPPADSELGTTEAVKYWEYSSEEEPARQGSDDEVSVDDAAEAAEEAAEAAEEACAPPEPLAHDAAQGDDADVADPLAHIISLKVLEFEANRCVSDSLMLAAVARRRAKLQALERIGLAGPSEHAAAYAAQLEQAISDEKARSREAKLTGNTKEALSALRRAKIMVEELENVNDPDSPVRRTTAA